MPGLARYLGLDMHTWAITGADYIGGVASAVDLLDDSVRCTVTR